MEPTETEVRRTEVRQQDRIQCNTLQYNDSYIHSNKNNYINWCSGTVLIIKVEVKAPRGETP